jgi:hypothetical protein
VAYGTPHANRGTLSGGEGSERAGGAEGVAETGGIFALLLKVVVVLVVVSVVIVYLVVLAVVLL